MIQRRYTMDLNQYKVEDLILSALRSEIDAKEVYLKIADSIKNAFLKDKIMFIADEEEKHRKFLEAFYKKQFADKELVIPEESPVPMPSVQIEGDDMSPVDLISQVMETEKAASEFYDSFAELFPENSEVQKNLRYLASMEMGHYRLFELERGNMEKYEMFDSDWPMMHVGP
jgi:rubrerythrin